MASRREGAILTIARFADRTGISPSALRFYDRKGLLSPAGRKANGYRVYDPGQIATAQLVNSLRLAGVSLDGIRKFLRGDEVERGSLLDGWRRDAAARILSLQLTAQYLGALDPARPQIHLHRWEHRSALLWFPAEAPPGPTPFAPAVTAHRRRLARLGVPVLSAGYVRTLDLSGGRLLGEVGFRVATRWAARSDARVEYVPPTLFVTLDCRTDEETHSHRLFSFLHTFGFTPLPLRLERHLPGTHDRYQLMIAIVQSSAG